MDFPNLFSPLRVGPVTLRNRVFSSGHDTVMAEDGLVSDRLIAYHEARAAGGVGHIVLQVSGVHRSAYYTSHVLMATSDRIVPSYARLADAVHRHDCRVIGQLFHPGREIMESRDGTLPVAYAPSAVPNERFHVLPRPLPADLVAEIVDGYGQAARRMREGGLDGVEIVASHGYLPAQFLNPRLNLREDSFGGSTEGRLRFLCEVIAAARTAAGPDLVVGLRISADELTPDGLTGDEVRDACAVLAGGPSPTIDYLSVTVGTSASYAGSVHIAAPMPRPSGYVAPLAATLRRDLSVPVFVAGRIDQPQDAEAILARGDADAVAMTRALICDPQLPRKARTGRAEEIRACIACNQACIGHFHLGFPISCIQHPETGRERAYGRLPPARPPRRVVVVGGGPAGLKAAAAAAGRGHHVVLLEAARRLGGQALLAQGLPGRTGFGGIVSNLAGEAVRSGVDLRTGVRADPPTVLALDPSAVVVATGAVPYRPAVETLDDPYLLDAWQVLRGAEVRGDVLVADWRCDWIGLGLATLLARRGHRVTLAVDAWAAGQALQQYVRNEMLADAVRARVRIVTDVRLVGVDGSGAYLQHTLTGETVEVPDVATTVLALGHTPVDTLSAPLASAGIEVHVIGDALMARTAEEAVLEGLRAAASL